MIPASKLFPWRTFYRVAVFQIALVSVAIIASGLAARYYFKKYYIRQVQSQLENTLQIVIRDLELRGGSAICIGLDKNSPLRLTAVDEQGRVLCDSWEKKENQPEIAGRPEVVKGLKALSEKREELSTSIDEEMVYAVAVIPVYKVVVRGGISLQRLQEVMRVFDTSIGIFLAAIAALLVLISLWAARRMVFPLGRLLVKTQNLIHQQPRLLSPEDLEEQNFGEWSDLESNIDDIGKSLEKTVQSLSMEQGELDTLMGAISDAILAVDQEEIPIFYNSRFEMVFGGGGVRRNVRLWEILRDPQILKAYKKALKEGVSGTTSAFALETPNQPKRYFSLSVSPLRRHGGVIYGAMGIFHDVTELKSAEQMRIDFVANVSHELRTPLTAIKGFTETLIEDMSKGKFDQNSKEFLSIIQRNSNRLMNLMQDLLDLSAIESTALLQKEKLSTKELTERVMKQLKPRFDAKKQTVSLEYSAAAVWADANRIEQVLINLLDNANKYTPEAGTVTVNWEPDRKGGKDVFLKVQDSGPGIPLEHHARLFERFYRIDKARSREQGGTGLGLAIVKHIMQRHEGAVTVESEPGKGSRFICRFPGEVIN